MERSFDTDAVRAHWNALHADRQHQLRFPSEYVVRWRHRGLGGKAATEQRVLDLGCGGGRHTIFFAQEGFETYATDISAMAIAHLREWASKAGHIVDARVAAVDELDLDDGTFDGVLCYGVYTYAPSDAIGHSVARVKRMLKPDGTFYLMMRSDRDWRVQRAKKVGPNAFRMDDLDGTPAASEQGLTMNLPDRDALLSLLADFAEVQIDSDEWSTNGGAFVNHDWHAVAVR